MKFEKDRCEDERKYERNERYSKDECCEDEKDEERPCEEQTHTHEFEGSTKLAELEEDPHNHRFAGVTGEEIKVKGGHIHKVFTRTDFFDEHFHFVIRRTGLQIPVGKGKHVHFVKGRTTENDGHRHEFQFATLIEDPLSPPPKEDDC